LNPQAAIKNTGNSTLLIQSSTQDANIRIPRMVKWSEINLPIEWLLENVSQPAKIANGDTNLDYIQQYLDGTVKISFVDLNKDPCLLMKEEIPSLLIKEEILMLDQPLQKVFNDVIKILKNFCLVLLLISN
jgi:hypothetical protein